MKYSIYNTILPLSEKLGLVYCGTTDQFVIYKRDLTPLLNSLSADQLAFEAHGLYTELVKGGGIVPDSVDEFANLKRIANEAEENPLSYRLIINPTVDCNFKCWYCYENHIKGSKMGEETLHRIILLISNILNEHKALETFNLSFFGGEPLLYYNEIVRPILDSCRKECQLHQVRLLVNFTSNGYLINEDLISHLTECNEPKCFQITLDGNRERHNKTRFQVRGEGSYDVIIANIKHLLSSGIEVILRINYTALNILSVRDVLNDLDSIDIENRKLLTVSFHRVWQDRQRHDLSDSVVENIVELFREKFNNVGDSYSMNNLRNPCYADKSNEAVINFDGNVFKCTARDFSMENRNGILDTNGKIIWNEDIKSRCIAKLSRVICSTCRLLPLCGGSCSQKSIENLDVETCIDGLSNEDINKVVLQRFYDCYVR